MTAEGTAPMVAAIVVRGKGEQRMRSFAVVGKGKRRIRFIS